MSKINIKADFKTPTGDFEFEGPGELKKGKILYKEKNVDTKILFSKEMVEIIRRSREYDLDCTLCENNITEGTYIINNAGTIELVIETKKLKIEDGLIEAKYNIQDLGKFNFSISYEEIK